MADIRICNNCGKPMNAGFCIGDGEMYFCSEKCLYEIYSEAEYKLLHENGEGYWTEWEDEFLPEPPATLRVCIKRPQQAVEVREIPNTIGALQSLVGGFVEVAMTFKKGVIILCDEEGLLKGKRHNCMGLVGDLVFVGTQGVNFRSLTDEDVLRILEWEAEIVG